MLILDCKRIFPADTAAAQRSMPACERVARAGFRSFAAQQLICANGQCAGNL